jgi:hypothetical protein
MKESLPDHISFTDAFRKNLCACLLDLLGKCNFDVLQYGTDDVEPKSTSLWFAGKEMLPGNKVKAHLGRHEKTKAVVKLQKKCQGAPAREPVSCCSPLPAQVSICFDVGRWSEALHLRPCVYCRP